MYQEPAGDSFTRWGVRADTSLNLSSGISKPASWAMAMRCKTVLVEHPSAASSTKALPRPAA